MIKLIHILRLVVAVKPFLTVSRTNQCAKSLEPHKWVKFREWKNVEETKAIVTDAMDKYQRMAALYKKKRLN